MVFLFPPFSAVYACITHVTFSPSFPALQLINYCIPSPLCPKECSKCGRTSCSCGPENCQCPKGACTCGKTGEWLLTTLSYSYPTKSLINHSFLPSLPPQQTVNVVITVHVLKESVPVKTANMSPANKENSYCYT